MRLVIAPWRLHGLRVLRTYGKHISQIESLSFKRKCLQINGTMYAQKKTRPTVARVVFFRQSLLNVDYGGMGQTSCENHQNFGIRTTSIFKIHTAKLKRNVVQLH